MDYLSPITYIYNEPLKENNLHSEDYSEWLIVKDMEEKIAGAIPKVNITLRTLEKLDDLDDIGCYEINPYNSTFNKSECAIVYRSPFLIRCSCNMEFGSNTYVALFKTRIFT